MPMTYRRKRDNRVLCMFSFRLVPKLYRELKERAKVEGVAMQSLATRYLKEGLKTPVRIPED